MCDGCSARPECRSCRRRSGTQCERLRRTVRTVDQTRVPRSTGAARRAPLSTGTQGIRRSLSSRAESPRTRESAYRGRRAEATRWPDLSATAARWLAELLRASGVTTGASWAHPLGPHLGHYERQRRHRASKCSLQWSRIGSTCGQTGLSGVGDRLRYMANTSPAPTVCAADICGGVTGMTPTRA
jgi:hypothetical protein